MKEVQAYAPGCAEARSRPARLQSRRLGVAPWRVAHDHVESAGTGLLLQAGTLVPDVAREQSVADQGLEGQGVRRLRAGVELQRG